jgi:hypothetical protein
VVPVSAAVVFGLVSNHDGTNITSALMPLNSMLFHRCVVVDFKEVFLHQENCITLLTCKINRAS